MDGNLLDAVVGHGRHVHVLIRGRVQIHVVYTDPVARDDQAIVHARDKFTRQRAPKIKNAIRLADDEFEFCRGGGRKGTDGRYAAEDFLFDDQRFEVVIGDHDGES